MTPRPRGQPRNDRGSQFLEFAVYLPVLLFLVVIAFETFLAFVAAERMENAAAVGARMAGTHSIATAQAAAAEALPDWMDADSVAVAANGQGGYYGEVTISLPLLFPASGLDLALTRRVDMPAT